MLEYGYDRYTMYVGEHLGNPERTHPPHDTTGSNARRIRASQQPVALRHLFPEARPFGIPDEQFAHLDGRTRMITKAPIRLLTLQALELNRRRILGCRFLHRVGFH